MGEDEVALRREAWGRALSGRGEDPVLVSVRELCEVLRDRCRRGAETFGCDSRTRDELCVSAGTYSELLEELETLVAGEEAHTKALRHEGLG